MALPDFEDSGYLPSGEWEADWDEVEERFAYNYRRREIFVGLKHVVDQLRAHGVSIVWLDGSFATDKIRPGDADVVYQVDPSSDDSDWADVGPSRRAHMKKYHRVDLWRFPGWQNSKNTTAALGASSRITIKEFFESDADGNPRGLVRLRMD
jgi:hypothetical protein